MIGYGFRLVYTGSSNRAFYFVLVWNVALSAVWAFAIAAGVFAAYDLLVR